MFRLLDTVIVGYYTLIFSGRYRSIHKAITNTVIIYSSHQILNKAYQCRMYMDAHIFNTYNLFGTKNIQQKPNNKWSTLNAKIYKKCGKMITKFCTSIGGSSVSPGDSWRPGWTRGSSATAHSPGPGQSRATPYLGAVWAIGSPIWHNFAAKKTKNSE